MMAVLDHLQKVSKRGDLREEPIQEAIFAISNAYSLNIHNSATRERYPIDGLSLPDVFKAGRAQLLGKSDATIAADLTEDAPAMEAMDIEKSSAVEKDVSFMKFVARLKETTSIFKGIEEGTPEYERRLLRAREKYDSKIAEKKQSRAGSSAAGSSSVAAESPKALAEKLKVEGNNELKSKNYQKAHDLYTRCIELDGSNAVFYSNRAAAKLHLSLYTEAVEDCKKAISLDETFVRPRERLASAYRYLDMTQNEVDALKGALQVAPHSESFQNQLREAEARLSNGSRSMPVPNMGGGEGGGIESLLGSFDPGMINNMTRAMGMPEGAMDSFMNSGAANQIGDMIRNNPGLVQQAMQSMMGGGMPGMAGMGGGMPDVGGANQNGANGNANGNSGNAGGGQG